MYNYNYKNNEMKIIKDEDFGKKLINVEYDVGYFYDAKYSRYFFHKEEFGVTYSVPVYEYNFKRKGH